jgi:GcrA cell cycle regulator
MGTPTWDQSAISDLRRMCAEGCSARVIADWLGVSRNSVIGKLTRLGLHCTSPERPPSKRKRKPQPKPKPVSSHPWRAPVLAPVRAPVSAPWVPQPRDKFPKPSPGAKHAQPELRSAPCLISELTEDACHWPMWGQHERNPKSKFYCGGMAVAGGKYCPHHAWINARGGSPC